MTTPPQRLPDGRLRVPMPAYGPGGIMGDAVLDLEPGDPMYAEWDEYLRDTEAQGRQP
jgi:hypothetical protein